MGLTTTVFTACGDDDGGNQTEDNGGNQTENPGNNGNNNGNDGNNPATTYDWIQMTQYIQYAENGTERFRQEYNYDAEGRETGYKYYFDGALLNQYRDYQYNGRTITCMYDTYSGGNVQSSVKLQRTYR